MLNFVFLFVYRVRSHSSWKHGTNRRRREIQVHIILYFLTITNRFALGTEHNTTYPRITSYFYDYLVRARSRVISYTIVYIILLLLLCVVGKCRKKILCFWVSRVVCAVCVGVYVLRIYPETLYTPHALEIYVSYPSVQVTNNTCSVYPFSHESYARTFIYV